MKKLITYPTLFNGETSLSRPLPTTRSTSFVTHQQIKSLLRYEKAIASGSIRAMNQLGLLYFYGHESVVPKDRERAYALFVDAARGGSSSACCNMGICLEMGAGVSLNIPSAIAAYGAGARLGSTRAMYNLGYLLVRGALDASALAKGGGGHLNMMTETASGLRFSRDDQQSYRSLWAQQVMEQDSVQSLAEGIRWLRAAADGGVGEAGYQLGRLYEKVRA